ncbi:sodium-independent sulfate anion transporter [Biomphalaria pfeifferi]|uniref:Sodium-independent sulfate anion transporter n=1 Tax=Biomphalaria pfeifferi TaxID=112525 RepID=A0AAD8BP35_BIOPF|nr:sodium-independent sulfate anion transporter [Biomphalaria pfeifferi]
MVSTIEPDSQKAAQNGGHDESDTIKMTSLGADIQMDKKPPVNGFNGSSYSVFPSDTSAKSTSTLNIGPYDDIVPSQISLKDRAKSCCRSCFTLDTLKKRLPIIVWLPQYNLLKLAYDLVAGITVGLTIIPQSLAFAGIAGLAPQYGLYCGVICCFVYVLMGSAKDITLGPSAITSLLTAAFATSFSPKLPNGDTDPTMAIMLTLTTGLIHIFMGVFKLGILVSFISFPVINAFSSAAAITIAVSQLRTLLGLKGVPNDFVAALDNIRQRLPYINVWDMTMGMSCILVVVLIKKLREIKFKDDPNKPTPKYILLFRQVVLISGSASTAIVVILASIILYILESNGIKAITPTGYIKPGLPEVRVPSFSIHIGNYTMGTSEMFSTLAPGIIVFPFIALIEAMAIGKYFARINRYKLDPSQELLSYGIANLLTAFFQGYPITGTFSRTAINSQCGVKTTLGCTFTGVIVIIGLAFMTPIFYYIPKCALAGVIIAAVLAMVDVNTFVALYKANKIDVFPYLVTFAATLLIGVQWGIFVGVGVSILILLYPIARPKLLFSSVQGFMIVTPTTGLNFPSAEYLEIKALDRALDVEKPNHIILNMEHLSFMDFSGIQAIKSLLAECEVNGMKLILAQGQKRVRRQLKLAKIKNLIVVHTIQDAIIKFTTEMTQDPNDSKEEQESDGHFISRL